MATVEFRSALARAIEEKGAHILPVRCDDKSFRRRVAMGWRGAWSTHRASQKHLNFQGYFLPRGSGTVERGLFFSVPVGPYRLVPASRLARPTVIFRTVYEPSFLLGALFFFGDGLRLATVPLRRVPLRGGLDLHRSGVAEAPSHDVRPKRRLLCLSRIG